MKLHYETFVAAPFGNYIKPKDCIPVTGSFTLVGSTGDTTKEDNLITILNNLKQNNVNYVKIKIQNDKLNKNFTIEFPKVYFLSGGVFDNIDFGELRLPLGFIAEGSSSENEIKITVNDS